MEQWYVLQTQPWKEHPVADYLRAQGLKVYVPLVKVHPMNPRAAKERSLLPGYLFVRVDLERFGVQTLQRTPGLRRLVQFGEQPAIVSEQFVAQLARHLARIRAAGGLALDERRPSDQAKIVRSPFARFEALLDMRLSESDRLRMLNEFIRESQGRAVAVAPHAGGTKRGGPTGGEEAKG